MIELTRRRFEDREEHTPQEARAGLTEYMKLGYVADDLHSEAGSRTLDYACEIPPQDPPSLIDMAARDAADIGR